MSYFKKLFLGKFLIVTNTVSGGMMMAIGDAVQQKREQWKQKYIETSDKLQNMVHKGYSFTLTQCTNHFQEPNRRFDLMNNITNNLDNHDLLRTKNMTLIGLIQGPFNHYFYVLLDRFLPGKSALCIIKKTIFDQFIGSPTNLLVFFIGLEYLERRGPRDEYKDIINNIIRTYKVDCCFWPPAQLVNFLFVPIHYRVIYINFMNVMWNIYLSCTKYDAE